jgi:DNA-binding IclR family transcriptional regulator
VNETGQYRLGTKLIELAGRALEAMSVARVAKPQLEDLVATTGETAHLMVFDANEGLYVEKVESPRSFRMPSQVGRRIPLHCTGVGKALLAYLPPEDVERVIAERGLPALSPNTITTPRALAKELATIRDRGYAVDAEEIELGLRCIAAPVFDHTGSVAASISIAGPSARVTPSREAELALRVMAAAAEISRQLGHAPESRPPVAETA